MKGLWTKSIGWVFLVPMIALFGGGCGDNDDDNGTGPDIGEGAMIRFVHASPDAPAVDVYVEGVAAPLVSDLSYGETSGYAEVDAGTYNVQIRAAGSSPTSTPVYQTGNLDLADSSKVTALAVGLLAPAGPDQAFRVLPLVEGFEDPGSGNAAVRIVHGSPDAPTVAIDVGADGTPEIATFARFAETGPAGVALPAGQPLRIAIWAGNPLARVTAFTTVALPSGGELFLIATGLLSELPREESGFGLLAVGPSGTIGLIRQDPVVFALHGSPDAPAVDIFAGSTELVDNLAFGELSGAVQVPPGSYNLEFRVASTGAVAATLPTPTLAAGQRYLATAAGFVGGGSFTLLPLLDAIDAETGSAKVVVLHASADAPTVDVGVVSGSIFTAVPDFSGLAFEDSSPNDGTSIPAAALTLGVAPTGTTTPAATFDVTTTSGLTAFAVAAGSLAGTGESFRLFLVVTSTYPWAVAEVLPN